MMLTGILKFISLIIFHLWKSPSTLVSFYNLNNYSRLHVCLSFRTYVRLSVRHTFIFFDFLQSFHKMSHIKVAWHVLRVKDMHPGSPSDPSGTAAAEAKPRCVYSISKPNGQSFRCQVRLLPPRRSRGAYTQF